MKYGKQTVFTVTIGGPSGIEYGFNILGDDREQLQSSLEDAGVPGTVDGELGIIVCKIEDATANEVISVLNSLDEAKNERKH